MSYISAPRLHQSTALLCPLLIKISGALKHNQTCYLATDREAKVRGEGLSVRAYMYSMVPQKVCVTVPS